MKNSKCKLTHDRFMRIAGDEADVRQGRDFLRSALRVAAGDDNLRLRIS